MRAFSTLTLIAALFGGMSAPAQTGRLFTGREPLQTAPAETQAVSPAGGAETALAFQPQAAAPQPGIAFPGFLAAPRTVAGVATDLQGSYVNLEGDFDGKNGIDVVTTQAGRLNVMLNDGAGNFKPVYGPAPSTAISASSGDSADLNGDGLPDVVLTDASTATLQVFLNQGNGQFATSVRYTAARPAGVVGTQIIGTVRLGDVNGDGKIDAVFPVSYANASTNSTIMVVFTFLGDGKGAFGAPVSTTYTFASYNFVVGGHSVELADLGGTGKPGLVLELLYTTSANTYYALAIGTAPGNGDGTFGQYKSPAQPVTSSNLGRGTLEVRDFNGDGKLDVLFADGVDNILLAPGVGDGTVQAPASVLSGVGATASLVAGDFNHDGVLDVAALRSGLVTVFTGIGNGTFNNTPASQYTGGLVGTQPIASADLNGDGEQDFVWVEPFYNQMSVYLGNGDATFRASPAITASNVSPNVPNNVQAATKFNVNGIGYYSSKVRADLLIAEGDHLDYGILQGKGPVKMSLAFDAPQLQDVDFVEPIAVDLNGDGLADTVMATLTGIKAALSHGDGTFGTLVNTAIPTPLGCVLGYGAAGDLNGDGKQDLVVGYTGNGYCYATGTSPSGYAVLLGDGTGHFSSSTFVPFGSSTGTARLADFDGDGKLDLVLVDVAYGHYRVSVLKGLGDGTFNTANPVTVFSNASYRVADVKAADIDGDGKPDLLMTYYGASGQYAVLYAKGNGDLTFAAPVSVLTGATGPTLEVADFNGDGLPDVALTLATTSNRALVNLAVLINNGAGSFAAPQIYVTPTDSSARLNRQLYVGDVNGDGAVDVVAGSGSGYLPSQLLLNLAGTSWNLTAQPGTATQGLPVQLVAQSTSLTGNLGGTVQFSSNGTVLGSASVTAGVAAYTAPSLPVGTNIISARYSGDTAHLPVALSPLTITVTALNPLFNLSSTPASLAIVQGQSASLPLTVNTNASFAGSVAFTCSNLPANTTCSFSPSSVALGGSATGSTQLTLTTSASAALDKRFIPGATGITVAVLLLVPVFRRKRFCAGLLSLLVLATFTGCGGKSNAASTPLGVSIVTVQATASLTGGSQLVRTIAIPITVQSHP